MNDTPTKKPQFLLIITSMSTDRLIRNFLEHKGLVSEEDFRVFGRPIKNIQDFFDLEKEQFLITDSFGDQEEEAKKYVRAAKNIHPLLKAASFSAIMPRGEPYDFQIKGLKEHDRLLEFIREHHQVSVQT